MQIIRFSHPDLVTDPLSDRERAVFTDVRADVLARLEAAGLAEHPILLEVAGYIAVKKVQRLQRNTKSLFEAANKLAEAMLNTIIASEGICQQMVAGTIPLDEAFLDALNRATEALGAPANTEMGDQA